jgi:hypothetical protein
MFLNSLAHCRKEYCILIQDSAAKQMLFYFKCIIK